jgi:hypothetical protein
VGSTPERHLKGTLDSGSGSQGLGLVGRWQGIQGRSVGTVFWTGADTPAWRVIQAHPRR